MHEEGPRRLHNMGLATLANAEMSMPDRCKPAHDWIHSSH